MKNPDRKERFRYNKKKDGTVGVLEYQLEMTEGREVENTEQRN